MGSEGAPALLGAGLIFVLLLQQAPAQPTSDSAPSAPAAEAQAPFTPTPVPFWTFGGGAIKPPESAAAPPAGEAAALDDAPKQTPVDENDDRAGPASGGTHQRTARGPASPRRESPQQDLAHLLNKKVILIDINGISHPGILIGLDKHSATLHIEIMLRGRPIMAYRSYLYGQIAALYPQ